MKVLDLFCGAGGASVGWATAGFEVVGVDIAPQPRYPFTFIQDDALHYLDTANLDGFDVIIASPPCERHSALRHLESAQGGALERLNLIPPTRDRLLTWGGPYVIENVEGARSELRDPITLCGSMFGIGVIRHRLFESNVPLAEPVAHRCSGAKLHPHFSNVYGNGGAQKEWTGSHKVSDWRIAMGIDWMTKDELRKAIPPIYAEYIAHQVAAHLRGEQPMYLVVSQMLLVESAT